MNFKGKQNLKFFWPKRGKKSKNGEKYCVNYIFCAQRKESWLSAKIPVAVK